MRFSRARRREYGEHGRLITATRLSISDRDEFKRGREYPLVHYSSLADRYRVVREYGLHVRGLTDTTSQAEILWDRGEKRRNTHCSVDRVGESDRSREEAPKTACSIYLSALNKWWSLTAKPNCLPMKITPARSRNFRWYLRRRGANRPIFFIFFFATAFSPELWRTRQFAKMVPVKLIARYA